MNLRLEELRRRLLEPTALPSPGNRTVYQRSPLTTFVRRDAGEVVDVALADAPPEGDVSGVSYTEQVLEVRPVPESVSAAVKQYLQQNVQEPVRSEPAIESGQYELAQAVAKVFDQTRSFEESLAGLRNMLGPIKQAGATLVSSIEPLRALEQQIQELAQSFDSIRTFQSQLSQLAESFEPMRRLEQQVNQFSEAFAIHLQRLSRSLDSARIFKGELKQLIESLDPVEEMQGRFSSLIASCSPKPMMS